MAWFDELREKLGGISGIGVTGVSHKVLTESDYTIASSVSVPANEWTRLAYYRVLPQNEYQYGYGSGAQPYNQGYIYVFLKDASGVEVPAKVRLVIVDANDVPKSPPVFEDDATTLHASLSDITQMKPLPLTPTVAKEDDKLIVEVRCVTASTISGTQTLLKIPVTNRWVRR